jgi:hypothetical protein
MTEANENLLDYYARPGVMTGLGEYTKMLEGLPSDVGELCRVVQANLLHIFWAERYGRSLTDEEKQAVGIRPVSRKLALIQARDSRPLAGARSLEERQAGNCRDFSTLLCAILRHQGVPARARCGFGVYFMPGHFEDHWVCEYWNTVERRWVLVDSQLDDMQRSVLGIRFDPLDVPRDQFIVAGQAWQMCRSGLADPSCFGIYAMNGIWFVWGNVMRDFLSLNKVEILPWDWWRSVYWSKQLTDPLPTAEEAEVYDRIAALTLTGDAGFGEIRAAYENDPQLQLPKEMIA